MDQVMWSIFITEQNGTNLVPTGSDLITAEDNNIIDTESSVELITE